MTLPWAPRSLSLSQIINAIMRGSILNYRKPATTHFRICSILSGPDFSGRSRDLVKLRNDLLWSPVTNLAHDAVWSSCWFNALRLNTNSRHHWPQNVLAINDHVLVADDTGRVRGELTKWRRTKMMKEKERSVYVSSFCDTSLWSLLPSALVSSRGHNIDTLPLLLEATKHSFSIVSEWHEPTQNVAAPTHQDNSIKLLLLWLVVVHSLTIRSWWRTNGEQYRFCVECFSIFLFSLFACRCCYCFRIPAQRQA